MSNVNNMEFNQLATVLQSIVGQATGVEPLVATNTAEFVSQAQTALKTGYDPVMNAISQVLGRTIFSVRPYSRKFKSLEFTEEQFGAHVRKLTAIDKPFEEDDRLKLVDGESVDQQRINKPEVLQTNFYGQNVYQKSLTIFRDQLDVAFSSADEFGRFVSMIMQNASDQIEQAHEETSRATVTNFIGAKNASDSDNVIHLVDVYNAQTGLSMTTQTIKQPDNFIPFTRWLYGYIKTLSGFMTERSAKYQVQIADKNVIRHTPTSDQRIYLYTPEINNMNASVISNIYHDEMLKLASHESVNFWQSINEPDKIKVIPSYTAADGSVATGAEQDLSNVLGVVFDREAMGMTIVNRWAANAAFNARGGYTNMFWHFTDRYFNDLSEKAVVLLLDTAE